MIAKASAVAISGLSFLVVSGRTGGWFPASRVIE